MMKYNEKVERFAPKLGRKNLVNGLSCPPFVYMEYSDEGMWVHYVTYCENIAHQKYKRCLAMAERCKDKIANPVQYDEHDDWLIINEYWERWHKRWLKIAEQFKEAK